MGCFDFTCAKCGEGSGSEGGMYAVVQCTTTTEAGVAKPVYLAGVYDTYGSVMVMPRAQPVEKYRGDDELDDATDDRGWRGEARLPGDGRHEVQVVLKEFECHFDTWLQPPHNSINATDLLGARAYCWRCAGKLDVPTPCLLETDVSLEELDTVRPPTAEQIAARIAKQAAALEQARADVAAAEAAAAVRKRKREEEAAAAAEEAQRAREEEAKRQAEWLRLNAQMVQQAAELRELKRRKDAAVATSV